MTTQAPIDTLVGGLRIGGPVASGALFMVPLFSDVAEPVPAPLSLDEALAADLLQIQEISESGSVPELRAVNISRRFVFLLDGEQVTGVKQNRTFNLSMLLAPGADIRAPVSCLEHGRWSMRQGRVQGAEHVHFARGRAAKVRSVSESLFAGRSWQSDQGKVWEDVDDAMMLAGCRSPTAAESDVYAARREQIAPIARLFAARPGQSGAVFGIGDTIVGLDLFASPELYAKLAGKLVRSYAFDAVGTQVRASAPDRLAISDLIDRVLGARRRSFPAPGVGETWRLDDERLTGAMLVHEGRCVHLEAFVQA